MCSRNATMKSDAGYRFGRLTPELCNSSRLDANAAYAMHLTRANLPCSGAKMYFLALVSSCEHPPPTRRGVDGLDYTEQIFRPDARVVPRSELGLSVPLRPARRCAGTLGCLSPRRPAELPTIRSRAGPGIRDHPYRAIHDILRRGGRPPRPGCRRRARAG